MVALMPTDHYSENVKTNISPDTMRVSTATAAQATAIPVLRHGEKPVSPGNMQKRIGQGSRYSMFCAQRRSVSVKTSSSLVALRQREWCICFATGYIGIWATTRPRSRAPDWVANEFFGTRVLTKMFEHCTDDNIALRKTRAILNARRLAALAVPDFGRKKTVKQARVDRTRLSFAGRNSA